MRSLIPLLLTLWQVPQTGPQNPVYRMGIGISAPTVLSKVDPVFTDEAREAYISGTVLLRLVVDANGSARDFIVVRKLGYGLDQAAIDSVKRWRFKPGMKDGVPVNVIASIEVNFRLIGNPASLKVQDSNLAAPILLSPLNDQSYDRSQHSVPVSWQSSADAVSWVVEWDHEWHSVWFAEFNHRPGEQRATKSPSTTIEPATGFTKWRWRVWPRNQSDQFGVPSEWRTFRFLP